ncbi:MAG: hypothetical protein MUW57_23640 [Pseudomonas sp.]|nr:hypothetical protein [Pseudomonas sp.]
MRSTYLRLSVPATIPWFPVRSGAARIRTVSLLDAALHNFEAGETTVDAYEPPSGFITRPTATGHFETLPDIDTRISVPAFTRLCRELDLGGQYSAYLEHFLDLNNPVAAAYLQHRFDASQIANLRLALHMARLQGDLSQASSQRLQQLLSNPADCNALRCHALSILSSPLTGIVLFTSANLERADHVVPVIAYIPHDPQHPLKEYSSSVQFMQALTSDLRQPAYQQFFSRFVNHDERGHFFADLGQRLSRVTWHAHTRGDPRPAWRETPMDKPELQFAVTPISGSVLEHLYQTTVSKLFNDARAQAVSTASADQKTRWERWSLFEKIGSALLQIAALVAAPFVPPVGLLMLGYTAYQLLDDTFEGIVDWAEGLKTQAFGHLMSVLEQMVQLGMFALGPPLAEGLLRQHLPAELWQFFDRLKPVTLPDGQHRLWQPDLAPYAQAVTLPEGSRANPLGLHAHGEQDILPLSGAHYALGLDPSTQTHYFKHPTRTNAYRPTAYSNGQGAWVSELDRPLSWDSAQLMRRLGHQAQSFSDLQLAQIRHVSGVEDAALRKLYMTREPLPPLLADTFERFKIDQDLQTFIDQMNSDDPRVQALADAQTQLLLLTNYGLWPTTRTLRLIDSRGRTHWEIPGAPDASVTQIHERQLNNGDLLQTLIEALDEPQRRTLLGEAFGDPLTRGAIHPAGPQRIAVRRNRPVHRDPAGASRCRTRCPGPAYWSRPHTQAGPAQPRPGAQQPAQTDHRPTCPHTHRHPYPPAPAGHGQLPASAGGSPAPQPTRIGSLAISRTHRRTDRRTDPGPGQPSRRGFTDIDLTAPGVPAAGARPGDLGSQYPTDLPRHRGGPEPPGLSGCPTKPPPVPARAVAQLAPGKRRGPVLRASDPKRPEAHPAVPHPWRAADAAGQFRTHLLP